MSKAELRMAKHEYVTHGIHTGATNTYIWAVNADRLNGKCLYCGVILGTPQNSPKGIYNMIRGAVKEVYRLGYTLESLVPKNAQGDFPKKVPNMGIMADSSMNAPYEGPQALPELDYYDVWYAANVEWLEKA